MGKTIYEFYYEFGAAYVIGLTLRVERSTPQMYHGTMYDSGDDECGKFRVRKDDLGKVYVRTFGSEAYLQIRLEGDSFEDAQCKAAKLIRDKLYSMADTMYANYQQNAEEVGTHA